LVDSPKNENIVIALRELAAGRVSVEDGETEHKEADHQEEK
jgi:DNA-directed RNA polymerase subunit K/omega